MRRDLKWIRGSAGNFELKFGWHPKACSQLTLGQPGVSRPPAGSATFAFDGKSYLQVAPAAAYDLLGSDYSIRARIKTRRGGTILCKTHSGAE